MEEAVEVISKALAVDPTNADIIAQKKELDIMSRDMQSEMLLQQSLSSIDISSGMEQQL